MRVEEETDECPDGEVEAGGGRYPAETAEEDGEVDFAPYAPGGGAAADEPYHGRRDEAD